MLAVAGDLDLSLRVAGILDLGLCVPDVLELGCAWPASSESPSLSPLDGLMFPLQIYIY